MAKKLLNLSFGRLLLISALIVLAVKTGVAFNQSWQYGLGCDQTQTYTAEDFELHSLQQRDDFYIATDSDSQLLMVIDGKTGGMDFIMESSMPTGEILVYYTTRAGQDYTENQRTWAVPVEGRENLYSFIIPAQYVHTLRIDPTIYGGNRLYFGEFILNPARDFSDFISFSVNDIRIMAVSATLLAAFFGFIQEIFTKKQDKVYKKD